MLFLNKQGSKRLFMELRHHVKDLYSDSVIFLEIATPKTTCFGQTARAHASDAKGNCRESASP